MFGLFKKKAAPPPAQGTKATLLPSGVPISGLPFHTPAAFQARFQALTLEQAEGLAEIYRAVITPGSSHVFAVQILKAPQNAFAISNLLLEHLAIENKNQRGGIATYLSFIANEVVEMNRRMMDFGITHEKWWYVHCDCPHHDTFDGQMYDISKGLLFNGAYIRPHGEFDCKCMSRVVLNR